MTKEDSKNKPKITDFWISTKDETVLEEAFQTERTKGLTSNGISFDSDIYLHSKVLDMKRCCKIRAESVQYAFVVKSSLLQKLQLSQDMDDFDEVLSREAKQHVELFVLTDKKRGQLVDMSGYFPNKETPEIFRMYENFELWSSRYINEQIKNDISFDGKNIKEFNPLVKTPCTDVYKLDLFTSRFVSEFKQDILPDVTSIQDLDYENDWLSIFNFYVSPILTYYLQSHDQTYYAAVLDIVRLQGGQIMYPNPLFSDADTNFITQLSFKEDYEGGGFEFIRYNCSIDTLEPGQLLIFPTDLTHSFVTKPLTKGEMTIINGKMNPRKHICNEIKGGYECAGFEAIPDELN